MVNPRRAAARRRLDDRLEAMKPPARYTAPPKGWIRAVRDALGMSAPQLGARIGARQQTIADFERSEVRGTIQLNTLRRVAEALDCTLVYALVPRSSLEETVMARARDLARKELGRIGHSMELEAQGVPAAEHYKQIEDYAREHVRERDLWKAG